MRESDRFHVRIKDLTQGWVEREIKCSSLDEAVRTKAFLLRQMILESESMDSSPLPSSSEIEKIMLERHSKSIEIEESDEEAKIMGLTEILIVISSQFGLDFYC